MGFLLKAFLFGLVVYYIFKSIGLVMFRMMGGTGPRPPETHFQSRREGDINVDFHSGKAGSPERKKRTEGDYIDYEEIK